MVSSLISAANYNESAAGWWSAPTGICRGSPKLAGLPSKISPNYIFCNDDGVTMMAAFLNKDRLAEFGGDREAALLGSFAELPCGPDLSAAERVGRHRNDRLPKRHPQAHRRAGGGSHRRRRDGGRPVVGNRLWMGFSIRGVACRRGVGRPAIREEP